VFVETVWSWLALIVTLFLGYLLVHDHRFRRLLPRGSPARIGALALVGAGVLGLLVNDTGIIITALVLVYLGPYLALLALDASNRTEGVTVATGEGPPAVLATAPGSFEP
jgi:phosphatidylserine synthase